jgi:riboflavin synthase
MRTFNLHYIFAVASMLLALGFIGKAQAQEPIHCETAFGEKTFQIESERVVFHRPEADQGRSISSIDHVRTEKRHKGFDKVLFKDGLKHRIHIDNTQEFSDINDYMVITSPKGHEMTYPLSCRRS